MDDHSLGNKGVRSFDLQIEDQSFAGEGTNPPDFNVDQPAAFPAGDPVSRPKLPGRTETPLSYTDRMVSGRPERPPAGLDL